MFWILSRTPLLVASALSWVLACLWWFLIPYRRQVAIDGYRRAFPEVSPGPDLRRMVHGVILGYFELCREMRVPGSIRMEYSGEQAMLAELQLGHGSFLLSGHFGSWDLCGAMVCRDLQLPASVIVKTPKNRAAADMIERIRTAFGMGLLPVRNVMATVYEEVQHGRQVVFLLDQRLSRGIDVPFFGEPARTSPALAHAAAKSEKPVHTLWFIRDGVGRHRAEIGPPIPMTGDVEADTTAFMKFYEERIRQHPHNWFWLHKRWRR
mgnify:FL=1